MAEDESRLRGKASGSIEEGKRSFGGKRPIPVSIPSEPAPPATIPRRRSNSERALDALHEEGISHRSYTVVSLMHFHEQVMGPFSEDIRELLMKMRGGKVTIFVVHG